MKLETKRPKKGSVYACFLLLGFIVYGIESVTVVRGTIPMLLTLGAFMWLASLYYGHYDKVFTEEELRTMPDTRAENKDTLFCFQMIEPCETNDFDIWGTTGNDNAIKDIRKGKYSDAKARLESYLDRHPEMAGAWVNLGLTYAFEKNYKRAEECFVYASKRGLNVPQIPQGIALCEFLSGRYKSCLEVCKGYDKVYPDGKLLKLQECCEINIDGETRKGHISNPIPEKSGTQSNDKPLVADSEGYFFENEWEFAIYVKCFAQNKKVNWLRGEDYLNQYKKGYQLFEQGQYNKAIEAYRKSLMLNPIGIRARFEICESYIGLNHLIEARNSLLEMKDFLVEDKSIARFYRRMGYIETEKQNYTVAFICYTYSLRFEMHPSVTQELSYISSQGKEIVVPNDPEKALLAAGIPVLESYSLPK